VDFNRCAAQRLDRDLRRARASSQGNSWTAPLSIW
jgi:hypothetical protein